MLAPQSALLHIVPMAVPTNSDKRSKMLRAPHQATRTVVKAEGAPEARTLYSAYASYNRMHFNRRLGEPMILITQPGTARSLGDYCAKDVHGLLSRIRVSPVSVQRGPLFVLDVLLHEMVHAYMTEVEHTDEPGYRGHGPKFAEKCNRIGERLGLPAVGVKGRDGLPDCAYWPMNVRPEGYYPEPFVAPKRKNKDKPESEEGEGGEEDESETTKAAPMPSKRAQLGARMAAELLASHVKSWEPEGPQERRERSMLDATARHLAALAEWAEAQGAE